MRPTLPVLEDLATVSQRLYREGVVLAEAGRFSAAITRWRAAIDMTPTNPAFHEHVAQAYMEMGHDFAAVQAAQEVRLVISSAFVEIKRIQFSPICQAVKVDPSWVRGHWTLARAQRNFGELELSRESFKRVIEMQPGNDDVKGELEEVEGLMARAHEIIAQQRLDVATMPQRDCCHVHPHQHDRPDTRDDETPD